MDKIIKNKDVSGVFAEKINRKYLRNKLGPLKFEENTLQRWMKRVDGGAT